MPVLSRGKHRNARKGACFMEFASYLAGERWSDHPACTHPLLAAMARGVNDLLDDDARPRIAWLIPDVVGLNSDDPRAHAWIAREAALAALPVVPEARQRVAAVGLLHCERHLAALGEPRIDARTRRALDDAPHARDWARHFVTLGATDSRSFGKRSAPAIVESALAGISESTAHRNDVLVALLERTIMLCRERFGTGTAVPGGLPAQV
jgi:hypothetical protein